jgi:hypothetical protein
MPKWLKVTGWIVLFVVASLALVRTFYTPPLTLDAETWKVIGAAAAALVGAAVGGGFVMLGQNRQARTDRQTAAENREAHRKENIADRLHADNRQLLEEFATINRGALRMPEVFGGPWIKEWRKIWTSDRSATMSAQAVLIGEKSVSDLIERIVRVLNSIESVTDPAWPGAVDLSLRVLARDFSGLGVNVLGAYLSGGTYEIEDLSKSWLTKVEQNAAEYETWLDAKIAEDERRYYEELSNQETGEREGSDSLPSD